MDALQRAEEDGEVAAGRVAIRAEVARVQAKGGRLCMQPADGELYVHQLCRPGPLGCEAIVDARRHEALRGQLLAERPPAQLISTHPGAAVNQYDARAPAPPPAARRHPEIHRLAPQPATL